MIIQHNVLLKQYCTMRLGGKAKALCEISNKTDLQEALHYAKDNNLETLCIGSGSNIVFQDSGFEGLVIVNKILGIEINNVGEKYLVQIASGEIWDDVVKKTAKMDLSGIENLSLIPGTSGAAPVQNIGAYGQEISETLIKVEAFDTETNEFIFIDKSNCGFSYRQSIFNSTEKGRYVITTLFLELSKKWQKPPFYKSLSDQLKLDNIDIFSPINLRNAVIKVRSSKLPDPKIVANTGSFFKNPIVDETTFKNVTSNHPNIPNWEMANNTYKLSAGWMIEKVGLKGFHHIESGMATWNKQALVMVNERAKTTSDLIAFKQLVIDKAYAEFNVTLIQEPELI